MNRLLRVTTPILLLSIALLLLAGCGGSDNGSSDAATSSESSASEMASETESAMADTSESSEDSESSSMSMSDSDESMASESMSEDTQDDSAMDASEGSSGSSESTSDSGSAVTVTSDGVAQVTIGGTDQMQYTVNEFTVEAGQEIELTFVHEGSLPVNQMGHNVVILQAGEDYMAFGRQLSSTDGYSLDNDYLPEGVRDGLVAYTDMVGGGETTTIRFTAPETPGDYPYLCSFPGHYPMMNGIMVVR
jgi:azurin